MLLQLSYHDPPPNIHPSGSLIIAEGYRNDGFLRWRRKFQSLLGYPYVVSSPKELHSDLGGDVASRNETNHPTGLILGHVVYYCTQISSNGSLELWAAFPMPLRAPRLLPIFSPVIRFASHQVAVYLPHTWGSRSNLQVLRPRLPGVPQGGFQGGRDPCRRIRVTRSNASQDSTAWFQIMIPSYAFFFSTRISPGPTFSCLLRRWEHHGQIALAALLSSSTLLLQHYQSRRCFHMNMNEPYRKQRPVAVKARPQGPKTRHTGCQQDLKGLI